MPACSPRYAGVTGEELEIRVWQNLAELVGGWEGGTELEKPWLGRYILY